MHDTLLLVNSDMGIQGDCSLMKQKRQQKQK